MKGMKGRILKKLKFIPQDPYHNQSPFLHSNESGRRVLCDRQESIESQRPVRDLEGYNGDLRENKENIMAVEAEIDGWSFRRPDPNSATLFDPCLLAAFKQAVMDYIRDLEEEPPSKIQRTASSSSNDGEDPLRPPAGTESIILYTTSLRGIRKTFEDCSSVKLLLENLKLVFVERDLSMHMEFRDELCRLLGFRAIPPRLLVKGRVHWGSR